MEWSKRFWNEVFWMKVALNPLTGSLIKTQEKKKKWHWRDADTEQKPRGDGGRDGREAATSPGMDTWSPQELEEAGRTPWPQMSVL